MATVLITGGTGLIGTHLLAAWAGRRTRLLAPGRAEFDLENPDGLAALVERASPDAVVHLAWSAGGTIGYRDTAENRSWYRISLRLAERCQEWGIRFYGTGSVIDDQSAHEEYTAAKAGLRSALEPEITTHRIGWLRPFYVFDPESGRPALLRQAAEAARRGDPVALNSPEALHDFVHVADVAEAIVTAVEGGLLGTIEIGSGRTHRVADLVERAGYAWTPGPASDRPAHADRAADIRGLRALGWEPHHTERYFAHA